MATWTKQNGWQTYSLPTGYKTNYAANDFAQQYPYLDINTAGNYFSYVNASDFADSYPYKNAGDFAEAYPDNKQTSRTIYFKLNARGDKIVDTSDTPVSGDRWRSRTFTANGGTVKEQLGDSLFGKSNEELNNTLKTIKDELNNNLNENTAAIAKRQDAANAYNANQDKNRQQAADSYNSKQDANRQEQINSYNSTQDVNRQKAAEDANKEYEALNKKHTAINNWSSSVARSFANASKGQYASKLKSLDTAALDDLKKNGLISSEEYASYVNAAVDSFDSFYLSTNITPWDATRLGAQPPTGGFDAEYYRLNTAGGQKAAEEWNKAQSSIYVNGRYLPDLDITGQYTRDTYLQWYYTTQGKAAGDRGNAAEFAELPSEYTEYLTDNEYQKYRDQVLGLADRFDNLKDWADAQDPDVLKEWYNSLPSYQKKEYDAGTLEVPTLDFIPDRLRDKIKMTKGMTVLEGELSATLAQKEKQQQQMFGTLTQDSLRAAAAELQKQKLQEQQFDFYKTLPGFNEVVTINESLANSLLGDTGIGGVLGWMGDTQKIQESLESSLGSATGIPSRSNAVYNWQKWFDEQLVTRYEEGKEFVDPLDESITYKLDAEFAKDYIDRYLKPRFDTSRSMTEFLSYMDIKQNEQNIFQTQSALDSLRDIADLRSKAYLDNIKNSSPLNFDASFYLNPKGNFSEEDPKYQSYLSQRDEVAADWEKAKSKGDTALVEGTDWTWNQWAYYYGLNPNDANQFAKLHYQVKGAAKGFDPAKDVITLKDAENYIQTKILPEIADEKLNIGDITFLNFVTPEEFADALLEGISPETHKEEWDKLLETLGLSEKDMGVAEIKQYIIDAFRTGAAKDIRESIKYLNEKKITPTQKELGVEYIERPEDVAPTDDPNATALYKIFQSAGYQGSEDDFYNDFMPDVDRSEMELVTQATSDKGLQASSLFSGLSSRDPFEALVSMQSLFDSGDKTTTTTKEEEAPSYFKLFEDDTDEDYKSESGKKILGEFTSLFKGFS